MNAYELADELQESEPYYSTDYKLFDKAANTLRQQADRIAELEKCLFQMQNACIDLTKNTEPVAWMDKNDPTIINLSLKWVDDIPLYTAPQGDGCGNCHACLVGVMENNMPVTSQRMIVCSDCGNKRCPKATNHRHTCTHSNEPNQEGSIY